VALPWLAVPIAAIAASLVVSKPVLAASIGATGVCIWLAIRDARWLWGLALAGVPVSLEWEASPGLALTLPTDALAVCLTGIVLVWSLRPAMRMRWGRLLAHPSARILALLAAWFLLALAFSAEPTRSAKWLLQWAWQVGAFFIFPLLAISRARAWRYAIWVWVPGLVFVVGYAWSQHAGSAFAFTDSSRVVRPFFRDHGTYATLLAFFSAWWLALASIRWEYAIAGIWALLAVLASYTRGAWLGLAAVLGLLVYVPFWRRFPRTAATGMLLGVVIALLWVGPAIVESAAGRRSFGRGVEEHLLSAFQLQNNVSNQERLNRWVAASAMIAERPWVGFGPGSFVTQYAPYQQARFRTPISTNRGIVGGAHSEPLAAGADAGVPALLLTLALLGVGIWGGIRGAIRGRTHAIRAWQLGCAAALLTYGVHALLNNFLDQDKAAAPFFFFLALQAWLDLHFPVSAARFGGEGDK
jgi:putative inorganic carbon (hco3(-)) transporter